MMNPADFGFLTTKAALLADFSDALHIDTGEGNAANLGNGAQGFTDGIHH